MEQVPFAVSADRLFPRMKLDSRSSFHRKLIVNAGVVTCTADALQRGNSSVARSRPVNTKTGRMLARPYPIVVMGRTRIRQLTAHACQPRIRQAACHSVSASLREKAGRRDDTARTLGTLLDGEGRERPSEREWRALVESIAAGDQLALRAFYDRTHRIVFTLTIRIVGDRESAEELTADVYHEVWRRAAKYDAAAGSVMAWTMNLARSRAIDRLRFDHRKKRFNPHPDAPAEASGDPCREALELRQRGQVLRAALRVLSSEEREVIETAFFSEMTYAEVADSLEQPLGTVKTRIRSGLAKLRIALASAGDGV